MSAEPQEQLYTIGEARSLLAADECIRYGHDYRIEIFVETNEPQRITCTRCGEEWEVR